MADYNQQARDEFVGFHAELMGLSHAPDFMVKSRTQKLETLMRLCASLLGVDRCSVWQLDDTGQAMTCELLYERATQTSNYPSVVLKAADHPAYFAAMTTSHLVDADDVLEDPRTQTMLHDYLIPLGIRSMLDAPVHHTGHFAGVICLESLTPRRWSVGLMAFVSAVAETISTINTYEAWRFSQNQLNYLAHTDPLTGLANQTRLQDDLRTLLMSASTHQPMHVLWLNIDRLKVINEGLGKHIGDAVIAEIGARLNRLDTTTNALVARYGGDGFVLVVQGEPKQLDEVGQTVLRQCRHPIYVGKHELTVSVSVGVAHAPRHGQDATLLLQSAESAMYYAKSLGRNQAQTFHVDLADRFRSRFQMENDLRRALQNHELVMHYQPIILAETQQVVTLEALVRWQHPTRGLLSPLEFLPLAQDMGLMKTLGKRVLELVCRDIQRSAITLPKISINLASEQISDATLPDQVHALLAQYNIPASALAFEVIEEQLQDDTNKLVLTLRRLAAAGIELYVDDFGTGYSSLARLKNMPFSRLKMDRSMVAGLPDDFDDCAIALSILGLAKGLGMSVVAEGIEDIAQAEWLCHQGCGYLQGYHYSHPMPLDQLTL
ncbi:putative bifunctional diguanylate cyclase/phosphodiesterase [Salinispirillum marinum]|uniref:Bifunctional diguanylate cyclase/phosphodiesterase n=2 Tax=Saccharospirillaceae TaxID=255527 RepID=A0ABV8BEQ8_9GAMM